MALGRETDNRNALAVERPGAGPGNGTPAATLPTQLLSAKYLLAMTSADAIAQNEAIASLPAGLSVAIEGSGQQFNQPRNSFLSNIKGVTAINDVALLPWVSDLKWGASPTARVTYTQGAAVIERHPLGTRRREVSISGIVGPTPFLVEGDLAKKIAGSSTSAAVLSGSYRAFLGVLELLDRWDASPPDTSLCFYALNEGWYYRCIPKSLALSQGGRQRNMLRYDLGLQLVEKVQFSFAIDSVAATIGEPKELTFAQRLQSYAQYCADGLEYAADAANGAAKVVQDGLHDYVTGPAYTVIRAADDAVDGLNNLANTVGAVLNTPRVLWQRVQVTVGRLNSVFDSGRDQIEAAFNWSTREPDEPDKQSVALLEANDAHDDIGRTRNGLMALTSLAASPSSSSQRRPVREGDTIESIALAVYGDATLWPIIAKENGLVPPYVSAAGLPGTVKPGESLLVRSGKMATLATLSSPDEGKREAQLYGRNLALAPNGDLLQSGPDDCADFALVEGVACVEQALRIKTGKTQGTDQLHPWAGIPTAIGRANTTTSKATLSLALYRCIAEDDRVARVDDFDVMDRGDAWIWRATPVLVGSEQLAQGGGVR